MRDWVKPFLTAKGDPNISVEEIERELLISTFCFRRLANCFNINFSYNIRLAELFGGVISDLPFEVFRQLIETRNLFFFFTSAFAYVQGLNFVEGKQGILCAFSEKLLELSDSCVRGGVVHELGHIVLDHYSAAVLEMQSRGALEDEADQKCCEWGFRFEIESLRGRLKASSQI